MGEGATTEMASGADECPKNLHLIEDPAFPVAWETYVGWKLATFYDRLTAGVPYTPRISFGIFVDGTGYIRLNLEDGTRLVAEAHRTFDIPRKEAHNYGFMIHNPEDKGIGIAKNFMRNKFSIYRDWGIERVFCSASLDDGGYVWAKYGFKASDAEWASLQPHLLARLYSLRLDWQAQRWVRDYIEDADPMALWTIADLSQNVSVDFEQAPHKNLTLGRALLYGTTWKGVFDFTDPLCVQRFKHRVEGSQ